MKPTSLISFFMMLMWCCVLPATAQTTPMPEKASEAKSTDEGVAITPSSVRLFLRPGETATKEVRVTNKTKKPFTFSVGFNDFEMGENGKPKATDSISSRYALSRWAVASPTYFEVLPGQVQKVQLTVTIPADSSGNVAGWTIMSIDQVIKRDPVITASTEAKAVALGVIPSFGFGVYVYQNPPDAGAPNLEIDKFEKAADGKDSEKRIMMHVKSSGNSIGFCQTYVELTNTSTGEMIKLPPRKFTILPGFERAIYFVLPKGMSPGKYAVIAVLDYGSKEDMKAAEMNLNIE